MVRFLQANLNRSRAAHDMALAATWGGHVVLGLEHGINVPCAYISPKIDFQEFKVRVRDIMSPIVAGTGEWVVMGDLNSKAAEWGSPTTDARGRELCDWIAALDMSIHNDGRNPTCIRANGQSFVDITLSTQGLAGKILNWRVEDDLTLSDHQHIHFDLNIRGSHTGRRSQQKMIPNIDFHGARRELAHSLEELRNNIGEITPEALTRQMKQTQERHTIRRGPNRNGAPYWWSRDIEDLRAECITLRRAWLWARRAENTPQIMEVHREAYKQGKRALVRCIRRTKRESCRTCVQN